MPLCPIKAYYVLLYPIMSYLCLIKAGRGNYIKQQFQSSFSLEQPLPLFSTIQFKCEPPFLDVLSCPWYFYSGNNFGFSLKQWDQWDQHTCVTFFFSAKYKYSHSNSHNCNNTDGDAKQPTLAKPTFKRNWKRSFMMEAVQYKFKKMLENYIWWKKEICFA